MKARLKQRDLFWLLAGCGVAAIIALIVGLVDFAEHTDRVAKQREETVIRNGFSARSNEIAAQVVGNIVWDETVRNLDNHYNRAWARDNVGVFFENNGGFAFSYVLDAADRLIFAMRDGKEASVDSPPEGAIPAALIARVRAEEQKRTTAGEPIGYALRHPNQQTSTRWVDGRLFVVTATVVASDFGHARIQHARAPIVITGREVDQDFLDAFARRYLLTQLHVHNGDSRFETAEAHAPIFDESGADVATLDWLPQTPGSRLLRQVLPWMLGLLVALMAALLGFYLRARRAAHVLIESEQRSYFMAYHDGLTGLSNRMHVEECLSAAVRRERDDVAIALHCIDLDRFKDLNDTYGHQVGDEALRLVADLLRATAAGADVCARMGGDEFVVVQHITDNAEAIDLAHRVITALAAPLALSVGPKTLGCSVGTALLESDIHEPLELLRRADVALYRAKAEGRGCNRFFDRNMDAVAKVAQRLKEDLRADLAAGKLRMVYQPQLHRSGEVVGLEALVRWDHDVDGAIAPSMFIPLAEEAGLIHELGEFTLRQAGLDSKLWPGLKVAVNVSVTQIQDPQFAQRAAQILKDVGADPRQIEIELTEGVFFSNEEQTRATLTALHEAGFSIALDDFGTGYSSLSYLQKFPIDKVKIDRAFVSSLGRDRKADAFFSAIVRLAQALEMRVIAEGVETNEQWIRLTAAGCPKIQGFVACKPLAADAVCTFLDAAKFPDAWQAPRSSLEWARPG